MILDVLDKHRIYKIGQEGVLLLNTVLTVRQGEANSHRDIGWETFTDEIIKAVSDYKEHVVFILWGNLHSKNKAYRYI